MPDIQPAFAPQLPLEAGLELAGSLTDAVGTPWSDATSVERAETRYGRFA